MYVILLCAARFYIFRAGRVLAKSTPMQHAFNMPYQLGCVDIVAEANTPEDAQMLSFRVKPVRAPPQTSTAV